MSFAFISQPTPWLSAANRRPPSSTRPQIEFLLILANVASSVEGVGMYLLPYHVGSSSIWRFHPAEFFRSAAEWGEPPYEKILETAGACVVGEGAAARDGLSEPADSRRTGRKS